MAVWKILIGIRYLRDNYTADEIEKIIDEAQDIIEEKRSVEETEYQKQWEEEPHWAVSRENCEALF